MGNLLLHLKEGQRLDINCTKLLNDEVRNKRKIYEHSRLHWCHDFRQVYWATAGPHIQFQQILGEEDSIEFRPTRGEYKISERSPLTRRYQDMLFG